MKHFSLSIPTKTYLKKYLHKRYGLPIPVNSQSLFGMVMISFLEKKVYSDQPIADRDFRYASFTDKVEVVLPAYRFYHLGLHVTKEKAIVLNRYFEEQFEEDLYRHCLVRVDSERAKLHRKGKGGCGYDKAINEFAALHGIDLEEDITFECLKKSEYRHRKKLEKTFSGNVLSSGRAPLPALFD